MTPAEQLDYANKQAELFYAPQVNELRHQQRVSHDQSLADQAEIKAVYAALSGMDPGAYGDIAANRGQLEFLTAVQESKQADSKFNDLINSTLFRHLGRRSFRHSCHRPALHKFGDTEGVAETH